MAVLRCLQADGELQNPGSMHIYTRGAGCGTPRMIGIQMGVGFRRMQHLHSQLQTTDVAGQQHGTRIVAPCSYAVDVQATA